MNLAKSVVYIMNQLKEQNPAQEKFHYWMVTMSDESLRITRAPAADPAQTEFAQKVVKGNYGIYVGAAIHPRSGEFVLMFTSTEDEAQDQYAAGYSYKPEQLDIAVAQIMQYLDDGKMPATPQ